MKKKNILITFLVLLLAAAVFSGIFLIRDRETIDKSVQQEEVEVGQSELVTYRNEELNFEITYPSSLRLIENPNGQEFGLTSIPEDSIKWESDIGVLGTMNFKILSEAKKTDIISAFPTAEPFKTEKDSVMVNNAEVERYTYLDAFSGMNTYHIYIPLKDNVYLQVFYFADVNPVFDTVLQNIKTGSAE